MNKLVSIFVVSTFLCAGVLWAGTQKVSLATSLKLMASQTQVVVVGDTDHGSPNLVQLFAVLVEQLSSFDKERQLCVFLESDARLTEEYLTFLSGAPFENTVIEKIKRIYDEIGRPYDGLAAERAYEKLLSIGRARNIQYVAYDISFLSELGQSLTSLFPKIVSGTATEAEIHDFKNLEDQRHQKMVESIVSILKRDSCDSAIVFTGEGHIQEDNHTLDPFQKQISESGFSIAVTRARSAECDDLTHANHSPELCEAIAREWQQLGFSARSDDKLFSWEFFGP